MNLVALIGNVASEPELRHTASGRAVCTFRLAVSRPGGEDADFFTVVTWERQAEIAERYCYVGRRLGIEGRLHQKQTFDHNADGDKRSDKTEIIAHRIQLLGSPRVSMDAQEEEE